MQKIWFLYGVISKLGVYLIWRCLCSLSYFFGEKKRLKSTYIQSRSVVSISYNTTTTHPHMREFLTGTFDIVVGGEDTQHLYPFKTIESVKKLEKKVTRPLISVVTVCLCLTCPVPTCRNRSVHGCGQRGIQTWNHSSPRSALGTKWCRCRCGCPAPIHPKCILPEPLTPKP